MSQKPKRWKYYPEDMSERERRFVAEFAVSGSAADAAREAGYAHGSARQTGSRLLTFAYIQKAVREYSTKQVTQCTRSLRRALRRLERQEVLDWDMRSTKKLLRRLIDLVEPNKT